MTPPPSGAPTPLDPHEPPVGPNDPPAPGSSLAGGSLLDHYRAVRRRSRYLTRGLAPEDQVVQSMTDVSPTKWHLAHTSWFFETFVLVEHQDGYTLHDPDYPYLFNSYYVQAGERHCRARRGYLSRPTVDQVWTYREAVDEAMEAFLSRPHPRKVLELVELGLNHEQQHQELLLTDIKHVFSVNPLRPAYLELGSPPLDVRGNRSHAASSQGVPTPAELRWAEFQEGLHSIGWEGPGFAYDNETPRHRRFLEAFALAQRPVTNGEFTEFITDGGYQRPELWMSDGWAILQENGWSEPFYWERRDDEWWTFTLRGMAPVHPTEPVCHVNWYEANAFARWAGARLPREDEWEVAAQGVPIQGNFVDSGRFHPEPLSDSDSPTPSASGFPSAPAPQRLFGDIWEWTSSPYSPYPGYQPAPGAVGEYNGKFMVNQFVLRGGSCATSRSHMRPSYRNFFHPDASWQFSGFRLAKDL
ncbi:MAG: ergothioneine biosynthesis protein EgtB [Gemmatimonadota bacterium]